MNPHVRRNRRLALHALALAGAVTLGAAAPAVIRLSRRRPRELLGAMKG